MASNIAVIGARRRRRGGSSNPTADTSALVATLGGDSVVLAAYDSRAGITQSSNLVSQWDDFRGAAGFGPSFTAAGTARPVWDPANLTLAGDANTVVMSTASAALFDLSGTRYVVYVGSSPVNGVGSVKSAVAITDAPTFSHFLQIGTGASSSSILMNAASTTTPASSTVASTTRRCIIAGHSVGNYTIQVANTAETLASSVSPSSGNNSLWLFSDRSGSAGNASAGVCRAVLVLNFKPSAGQITSIANWANSAHSAVLA